jgi:hypothetical protein
MGWVMPVEDLEANLRYRGVFVLVDVRSKKLRFYGFKKTQAELNQLSDQVNGRNEAMADLLIKRARAKGE